MNKRIFLALLVALTLILSGCGSRQNLTEAIVDTETKKIKIPDNLEGYLGKTIEELSQALGLEPDIEYLEEGENGYPETAFFNYKSDPLLYVTLSTDSLLSGFLNDSTLYISRIAVELPYKNTGNIEKDDNLNTVKDKLNKAGIEFDVIEDSVNYFDGNYSVNLKMYGKDTTASQIHLNKNYNIVDTKMFDYYCESLPGGYFLNNGDYIIASGKGLLQIYKNEPGYCFYSEKTNGSIEKTESGLFFVSDDKKYRFSIDQNNGELTYVQNDVPVPASGSAEPSPHPVADNPLLTKYKEEVKKYQSYALDKWGYDTKRFYDVADFNNDGTLELYSIFNMSSPAPGTLQQSKLEIYTLRGGEIKFLDSYTATEPMLQGGTEFTNYYKGFVPGEGDFFIIDNVNTRMGTGHSIRVGRITGTYQFEEVDSIEFSYPNMDLINGELITDYPRAAELLAKYGISYDNLLIGLNSNYSLAFGYAYNEGGYSYDYFQLLLSGEKDNEILFRLTGEWPQ